MDGITAGAVMQQGMESASERRMESAALRMNHIAKNGVPGGGEEAKHAKIREAAEDFESVFISQMLSHMFAGVETNELFGGGQAEDIYKSMMVDEYGKLMSKSGGVGVADHVMKQLLQQQEGANAQAYSLGMKQHNKVGE